LHPIGMTSEFWEPQRDAWLNRFRIVRMDFPGHGQSKPRNGAFEVPDLADDILDVIGALHLHQAFVVGLSLGGMVAQWLAVKEPGLFRGIVIANANAWSERELAHSRAIRTRQGGMAEIAQEHITRWFSESTRERRPDLITWTIDLLMRNDPAIHAATWEAIGGHDIRPLLSHIQVPMLFITGEADQAAPPDRVRQVQDAIPTARMAVIPAAGHFSSLEKPDTFNSLVESFISEVQR